MAIFHMNVRIVSRSKGRGAVSVAAYNSGQKLKDFETGRTIDKTRKTEVVYSSIELCSGAPERYLKREVLWNEVEKRESYPHAQLARNIEFSIPKEITSRDQQIEMIRGFIRDQFVSKGMISDWSIHDKGDGNPHCHCMLTMRGIENGEWVNKTKSIYRLDEAGHKIPRIDPVTGEQMVRDRRAQGKGVEKLWERINLPVMAASWNSPGNVEVWRKAWADVCNEQLEKIGVEKIDHRSNARRGIERIPQIHEGYMARALESNGSGTVSERCMENRRIRTINHFFEIVGNDRIENRGLVEFIIEKVRSLGNTITSVPKMIIVAGKDILLESLKVSRMEKGDTENGRTDIERDRRTAGTGDFQNFVRELGVDSAARNVEGEDCRTGKPDRRNGNLDCVEPHGLDVRYHDLEREAGRDPLDTEEDRREGSIDRGL